MNKQIAALTILTLAACPADDGTTPDTATGTGLESTTGPGDGDSGPDLPPETTGDGDGDPGTTGDGDGDPTTGDGDPTGDGDGDTGSEAVPYSLEVEADGERIGYLMGVHAYGVTLWDDVNEVTFGVNQVTGHVISGQVGFYHATADCTGQRYANAGVPLELCETVGPPIRRHVYGDAESNGGHTPVASLASTSGAPALVNIQSLKSGANCVAVAVAEYCVLPVETTDVIPTTFPLPITVVETTLTP